MSDDILNRVESFWRNRGVEFSPESFEQNFMLFGPKTRSELLDQFDTDLRKGGEIADNEIHMRRAAETAELRQSLDNIHHELLKVNR